MREAEKTVELKPCPFCGGEARAHEKGYGYDHKGFVVCACGAQMVCQYDGNSHPVESAVENWNRRAEPPNPPLTLEELHGMIEEPVWIESPDMPNLHGWAINYGLDPDVMYIQYAEIGLDTYGKTWLAYRRRPEEAQR